MIVMCFKDSLYKIKFFWDKKESLSLILISLFFAEIFAFFGVNNEVFYLLVIVLAISFVASLFYIIFYIHEEFIPMKGKITNNLLYKEITHQNNHKVIEFEIPSFILALGFKSIVKFNITLYDFAKNKLNESIIKCENEKCLNNDCKEPSCKNKPYYTLIIDTSNQIIINSSPEYIEERDFESANQRGKRFYYLVREYDNTHNQEFSLEVCSDSIKNNKGLVFKIFLEYGDKSSEVDFLNKNPKETNNFENEIFDEKISFCNMNSLNDYLERN